MFYSNCSFWSFLSIVFAFKFVPILFHWYAKYSFDRDQSFYETNRNALAQIISEFGVEKDRIFVVLACRILFSPARKLPLIRNLVFLTKKIKETQFSFPFLSGIEDSSKCEPFIVNKKTKIYDNEVK